MPGRSKEEFLEIFKDFKLLDGYNELSERVAEPKYTPFDGKSLNQEKREFFEKYLELYSRFRRNVEYKSCELDGFISVEINMLQKLKSEKFKFKDLFGGMSKDAPHTFLLGKSWTGFMKLLKNQIEGKNTRGETENLEEILDTLVKNSNCNIKQASYEKILKEAKYLAFDPNEVTIGSEKKINPSTFNPLSRS